MKKWQDAEQGPIAQKFASFVNDWTEEMHIDGGAEVAANVEVYNMTADGVPFSFRRVGNKHSLIFGGQAELIKKSTFDFFKIICTKFFEDSAKLTKV